MRKLAYIFSTIFLSFSAARAEKFISLNLCADRLLIELARPEQIVAQSPFSNNPLMMLDKLNHDKPTVEPQLHQLLPYLESTVLINENFYPQLVEALRQLGVKMLPINDPQTPEQLFALIRQIGKATGNETRAEQLVAQLDLQKNVRIRPLVETLMLSDTGVVDSRQPPYRILLDLFGLSPLKIELTAQNFSLEKVLLSQPNLLLSFTDKQGYNEQAELLSHPVLQKIFRNRPLVSLPLKYTYCVDHGLWQGAAQIERQLK